MDKKPCSPRHPSIEELKALVRAHNLQNLGYDELTEMLYKSNAIYVDGHWELLAGYHTDIFFQFSKLGQYPKFISRITEELLMWIRAHIEKPINVTLSPRAAGKLLSFSIAAALNGEMNTRMANSAVDSMGRTVASLKEGFEIREGERVLIVNDLISTGAGIQNLLALIEKMKAIPVGICVFANRNPDAVEEIRKKTGLPLYSTITINASYWPKSECPLCKENVTYRFSSSYYE